MHIPSIPGVPGKLGKALFVVAALALLVRFKVLPAGLHNQLVGLLGKVPLLDKLSGADKVDAMKAQA